VLPAVLNTGSGQHAIAPCYGVVLSKNSFICGRLARLPSSKFSRTYALTNETINVVRKIRKK
jgi:hypothetical protein